MSLPGLGGPIHRHMFGHLSSGLLQCSLHRGTLEDHPEATTDPKFNHMNNYGHLHLYTSLLQCNTNELPGTIQGTGCNLMCPLRPKWQSQEQVYK